MDSLKKNKAAADPDEWDVTPEQFEEAVTELVDAGIAEPIARGCATKMLEILPLLQSAIEDGNADAARRLSMIVVPD